MRRTAAARDGACRPARAGRARRADDASAERDTPPARRPHAAPPTCRHAPTAASARRRRGLPPRPIRTRGPSPPAVRLPSSLHAHRPTAWPPQGGRHARRTRRGGGAAADPPAALRVASRRGRARARGSAPQPVPRRPRWWALAAHGGRGGTANAAASGRGALRGDLMAPTPPRSMSPARWSRGARRQPDVSVCLLVRAEQVEWGLRVATRGQGAFSVPTRTHKTNLRTKPTHPTLPCGHATLVTRSPPSQSTCLPHHPATRHTNRLDKHAPVHTNPCQQHPTLNKEKKNLARPTTCHHPHTRATPQRLTTTPLCLVSSLAPNTHTRGPPPLKAPTTQQDAHPRGSLHHPAGRAASGPASTFPPVSSILPTSSPGGPKAAKRVTPRPKPAAGRCQREQPLAGKSHRQAPSPYQRQPAPGTNAGGKSQPPAIASGRLPSKLAANGIPPPSPPAACRQRQRR